MCGAKSRSRWRLLAALLLLCSVSSLAAAPESVTIPLATWKEITARVTLLGTQLDELTLKSNMLEAERIAERTASEKALKLRDERIVSLNASLQRSTMELRLKGKILIGESVALAIFAGATVFLLTR